jgi:phosphoribosyl-AMP cyclohydrolase
VLLIVNQLGPACHTGRPTCFYNAIDGDYVHIISEPAA